MHVLSVVLQAKCAGTSLRALLYNHTLGTGTEVCIPSYSHSFLVLSREGCHYDDSEDSRKPALMAGHFTWQEYEWMLVNARRLVSRDGACQACWCLFHRLRSLGRVGTCTLPPGQRAQGCLQCELTCGHCSDTGS
jgi:hypothetical protein